MESALMEFAKAAAVQVGRRVQPLLPKLVEAGTQRFPFVSPSTIPWTPLRKPLNGCTVALITSAGLYPKGSEPFDMKAFFGDWSYRLIPGDIEVGELRLSPVHYDHGEIDKDRNVVFPLDRLRELAREGVIGRVAPRHFGFMGYVIKTRPLTQGSAHEVALALKNDGVDAVVLIPACILCHQTVPLIQRVIESQGIPTVSFTFLRGATERLKPPRALHLPATCGHLLGRAFDRDYQRTVLLAGLRALETIDEPGTILEIQGELSPEVAACTHS